jgi:hypothetical protein
MHIVDRRALLAQKLSGQRLVIPDMRPILTHWPSQQHTDYEVTKDAVDKRFASYVMIVPLWRLDVHADTDIAMTRLTSEKNRKAISEADPALLAAR